MAFSPSQLDPVNRARGDRWRELGIKDYRGLPIKTQNNGASFVNLEKEIAEASVITGSKKYNFIMGKALSGYSTSTIDGWEIHDKTRSHSQPEYIESLMRHSKWKDLKRKYESRRQP